MASTVNGTTKARVRKSGAIQRLLTRPELGAIAGTVLIFIFFAVVAGDRGFLTFTGTMTYLEVAAQLGIIVVPASLLMIAREFDLSVGSVIGATGMIVVLPVVEFGWPLWISVVLAFGVALLVGFLNGYLVVRTGLPSFIITLASLYALRGATLGFTRLFTGRTQVSGLEAEGPLGTIFAGEVGGVPASVFWWIGLGMLGTWVLVRTGFGNWIFGVGGDPDAARNVGVPVDRVKILLFMATSLGAALVGVISVLTVGSADVLRGELREFETIIAIVVGGTLLTGGYGSVIGPMFGAVIFGMVNQGIFFTGVNTDWFRVFLGGLILVAVLANTYIRKKALEAH